MLSWSNDRGDYRLLTAPNPIKRKGAKDVCIRFVVNRDGALVPSQGTAHPFSGIVSDKDESEKAVVTSIFITFLQNDFGDAQVYLERVFPPKHEKYDEYSVDNGAVIIPCQPAYNDRIPESDALIYRTPVDYELLYCFVGQEDRIFKPNIVAVNYDQDEQVDVKDSGYYQDTHPLVHFIIANRDNFVKHNKDFVIKMIKEEKCYKIAPELLERVRSYLKAVVFDHTHYTRFEETSVSTNLEHLDAKSDKGMVVVLKIHYVVVNKN